MDQKKHTIAVIPARAGSRGIPNKNIRLIGGNPLVYYSIKTALDCPYIDRIIVTTDSESVATIAAHLGVAVHWRKKELCADDVTLDAVVYDAVKGCHADYVITMQPTSPTLKPETLSAAIRYSLDTDCDSVISVVNRPHLSWTKKDNIVIPNYSERVNRQFLPPHYMETGAFVISKSSAITPVSRLGKDIQVFEISEEEAIDIDSSLDLILASELMVTPHVALYVNGNKSRGIGHIYRALEIADEFYFKPDIFYDINQTDPVLFGDTKHDLIGVNGIGDLFLHVESKTYDIFINDILNTSIDYMIALKNALPESVIINFEDDGEGAHIADLVFNALYERPDSARIKSGKRYYVSPKDFLYYTPIKIKENVKKVFISFGGSDPQNYSDRILNIVKDRSYEKWSFTVVLGKAKEGVDRLFQYNKYPHINVVYNVTNMPELMSECDIAVTSRGRTGYELAMLGIPTISMAQNRREERHNFVSNENGFSYIGLNPSDTVIKSTIDMYLRLPMEDRLRFQEKLLAHDLRNGRQRVLSLIKSLL